jgi:Ca-activated chloride channel family protein
VRFVHPELLWAILALPLLGAVAWGSTARRRRKLQRFAGGAEFLDRFSGEVCPHRRAAKHLLLYLALLLLIVSAARPQWGTRLEPVTRKGVDVVVVLDKSLSMAAEDMAPNRLGYSKHAIDSLLKRLAGDRVSLVTFAGQPTLACPLTLDHAAVRLFLDAVEVESAQVPGTALAEALRMGIRSLESVDAAAQERGRALVLFSDGEDHEGGLDVIAGELGREGVALYAVGVGTTRGAPIPIRDRGGALTGYKKDREKRVVTTRLDESIMELLALDTGGRYYRATATEVEVDEIAQSLTAMDAHEFGAVLRARYEERYQVPLLLALCALAAETLLGDRRRKRRSLEAAREVPVER